MIGILPTLMPEHLSAGWMSDSTRYQALNDSIFTARGEDIVIDIAGPDALNTAFEAPAQLPALAELADPAGWLRRVAGRGR